MGWIILALIVLAAGLALVKRIVQNRHEQEQLMMERVRTTAVYRAFYPTLEQCQRCCVEQILIRREEITIRMFRPMNEVVRFNFAARGLEPVDNPDALQALARALALDAPMLDDPRQFWFARKSAPRDVGQPDVWYEYNVQPEYRDRMLRAWYDRPEPEDGIVS